MGTQVHKIDPSVLKQLGLPQKLIQKTTLVDSPGTSEIECENNSSSKNLKVLMVERIGGFHVMQVKNTITYLSTN